MWRVKKLCSRDGKYKRQALDKVLHVFWQILQVAFLSSWGEMRPRSQSLVKRNGHRWTRFQSPYVFRAPVVAAGVATSVIGDGSEPLSLVLPSLHRKKGVLECEHGAGRGLFEVRGGA